MKENKKYKYTIYATVGVFNIIWLKTDSIKNALLYIWKHRKCPLEVTWVKE
jgi:hypothetical protein